MSLSTLLNPTPSVPTYVSSSYAAVIDSGYSSTVLVNTPAGAAPGNLLVAIVSDAQNIGVQNYQYDVSPSGSPQDWTKVQQFDSPAEGVMAVFYKYITGDDPGSHTFYIVNNDVTSQIETFNLSAVILNYSGIPMETPIDAIAFRSSSGTASTNFVAPSITVGNSGAYISAWSTFGGVNETPPAGMTLRNRALSPGNYALTVADSSHAAGGASGTFTATGASARYIAVTIGLGAYRGYPVFNESFNQWSDTYWPQYWSTQGGVNKFTWDFEAGNQYVSPGPNWSLSTTNTTKRYGNVALVTTRTSSTPNNGYAYSSLSNAMAATNIMAVSVWVFASASTPYSIAAQPLTSGNVAVGPKLFQNFVPPANKWYRATLYFVAPTNSVNLDLYITDDPNLSPTVGSTLIIDDIEVNQLYGSTDIQNSQGRLGSPNGASSNSRVDLTNGPVFADTDVSVKITPAAAGQQQWAVVALNGDGQGRGWYSGTGYALYVGWTATGGATLSLQLHGMVNGVDTALSTATNATAIAAPGTVGVRLQRIGNTLRGRVWNSANAEPNTWNVTATIPGTPATGIVSLTTTASNSGTAQILYFDDVRITDPTVVPTATVTGSLPVAPQLGAAAISTVAVPYTETFSSPTWPNVWALQPNDGAISIQNGAGRLAPSTTQWSSSAALLKGTTPITNTDLTFTLATTATAATHVSAVINSPLSYNGFDPLDGYILYLYDVNSENPAYILQRNSTGSANVQLIAYTRTGLAGSTGSFKVRLQRSGSTIQFRIWRGIDAEPSTWTASATDPTPLGSGYAGIGVQNAAGGTSFVDVDNLTFGAPVPTVTGTLALGVATPGAAIGVRIATGPLRAALALTGTSVKVGIATGQTAAALQLTGTASAVRIATGALAASIPMQGTAVPVAIATGQLPVAAGLSGVAVPALVGLPFTETFPGADGSAWPSAWTKQNGYGAALTTATVQGGAGRLSVNSGSYATALELLTGIAPVGDSEISGTVRIPVTGAEQYIYVGLNSDSGNIGAGEWAPKNNYFLDFYVADPVMWPGDYDTLVLYTRVNGTDTQVASIPFPLTTNHTYGFRFQRIGQILSARVWDTTGAEPTTWTLQYTISGTPLVGVPYLIFANGSDAKPRYADFDNITVSVPIDVRTVTGILPVTATLTGTAVGYQTYTPIPYTEPFTGTNGAPWPAVWTPVGYGTADIQSTIRVNEHPNPALTTDTAYWGANWQNFNQAGSGRDTTAPGAISGYSYKVIATASGRSGVELSMPPVTGVTQYTVSLYVKYATPTGSLQVTVWGNNEQGGGGYQLSPTNIGAVPGWQRYTGTVTTTSGSGLWLDVSDINGNTFWVSNPLYEQLAYTDTYFEGSKTESAGRLVAEYPGSAWDGMSAHLNMPVLTDTDVTGTIVGTTDGVQQYAEININGDESSQFYNYSPNNCYMLCFNYETDVNQQGFSLYEEDETYGRGENILANAYRPMRPTTKYAYRFQRNGSTLRARVWEAGSAEPTDWGVVYTLTNTPIFSGKVSVGVQQGGDGAGGTFLFDDLTVTVPLPEAIVTGTLPITAVLTGTATASVSRPYTETFSLPDGSDWPSIWTSPTGGSATIVAGKGRTVSPASEWASRLEALTGMPSLGDTDLSGTVTALTSADEYVALGINSDTGNSNTWEGYNSYNLYMNYADDSFQVSQHINGFETNLGASVPKSIDGGVTYGFRFQRIGQVLRAKVWKAASAEPTDWDYTYTLPGTPLTGFVTIAGANSADAVARTFEWDNITVAAPAAEVTGVLGIASGLTGQSLGISTQVGMTNPTVGLVGTASKVAISTGTLPMTAALGSTYSAIRTTTGSTSVAVATPGQSSKVAIATASTPVTAGLTGAATKVATVSGVLGITVPATGSALGVMTATGQYRVTAGMAGASLGISTQTAMLGLNVALTETDIGVAIEGGVLGADVKMAGAAIGISTGTGQASIVLGLIGTSSRVAITTGQLPMSVGTTGLASGIVTTSGTLSVAGGLFGASVQVGFGTGTLAVAAGTSGASTFVAVESRALGVAVGLTGASIGIATTTGSLPIAAPTSGASQGVGITNSVLGITVPVNSIYSAIATHTGMLPATIAVQSVMQAVRINSGPLLVTGGLVGVSVPVAITTGALPIMVGAGSVLLAIRTQTGALPTTAAVSGVASGIATLSGELQITPDLAATAVRVAIEQGTLDIDLALTETDIGVAIEGGVFTVSPTITGAATGIATTTGTLPVSLGVQGGSSRVGITTTTLPVVMALSGASVGVAITQSALRITTGLSGASSAIGLVTGALAANAGATATPVPIASVTGSLPILIPTYGSFENFAVTFGSLGITMYLAGSMSAIVTTGGALPVSVTPAATPIKIATTTGQTPVGVTTVASTTQTTTTTGALPISTGLTASSSVIKVSSGTLGISAAINSTASQITTATGSFSIAPAISGTAQRTGIVTGSLPISTALNSSLSAAVTVTGSLRIAVTSQGVPSRTDVLSVSLPITIAISGAAVKFQTTTSGNLGAGVALSATATKIQPSEGVLPVSVGMTANVLRIGVTTGALPAAVAVRAETVQIPSTTSQLRVNIGLAATDVVKVVNVDGTLNIRSQLGSQTVPVNITTGTLPLVAEIQGTVGYPAGYGWLPVKIGNEYVFKPVFVKVNGVWVEKPALVKINGEWKSLS